MANKESSHEATTPRWASQFILNRTFVIILPWKNDSNIFLYIYTALHTTSTNRAKTHVKFCFAEALLDSSFVPHDVAPSETDDVNQDLGIRDERPKLEVLVLKT